jgi:hypothetical protein
MTEHKATPEQWSDIERFVRDCGYDSCLLELRSRVEALEAAVKPAESNYPAEPDSSLVERAAGSLTTGRHSDARAAILEITAWLRLHTDLVHGPQCALWLEREADRHPS